MVSAPTILIADDDPNFVLLFRTALDAAGINSRVRAVPDGLGAVHYLEGRDRFADRGRYPFPSLVLLDLRLPVLNGFEVLKWIRLRSPCGELPVIILTGSDIESENAEAWHEGASEFLIKPFDFAGLTSMAEHITEAWLPGHSLHAR